jgi:hypothetical protein
MTMTMARFFIHALQTFAKTMSYGLIQQTEWLYASDCKTISEK